MGDTCIENNRYTQTRAQSLIPAFTAGFWDKQPQVAADVVPIDDNRILQSECQQLFRMLLTETELGIRNDLLVFGLLV